VAEQASAAPASARKRRHFARRAEYIPYLAMKVRCSNPKADAYPWYGGRGIRVCAEWERSFDAFYRDVGPRPSSKHSLDRIDSNGHYEPGNVRWATKAEQARNTSANVRVEFRGETLTLVEWAERSGVPYHTLKQRIALGWPMERALDPAHQLARGTANQNSKLDAEKVRAIRAAVAGGESTVSVGKRFGVSSMTVSTIARRKTWRHVP
jgi:hypothetical protein